MELTFAELIVIAWCAGALTLYPPYRRLVDRAGDWLAGYGPFPVELLAVVAVVLGVSFGIGLA